MEPQLPNPSIMGPETRSQNPAQSEARTGAPLAPESIRRPETAASQEKGEQPGGSVVDPASLAVPLSPPMPILDPVKGGVSNSTPPSDDSPATASDDDLIEKEWVEKAKSVISQTKSDPYEQERAVSKLQAQYLQKRYNKTIKLPRDE